MRKVGSGSNFSHDGVSSVIQLRLFFLLGSEFKHLFGRIHPALIAHKINLPSLK
jgi:hypothetical protein